VGKGKAAVNLRLVGVGRREKGAKFLRRINLVRVLVAELCQARVDERENKLEIEV